VEDNHRFPNSVCGGEAVFVSRHEGASAEQRHPSGINAICGMCSNALRIVAHLFRRTRRTQVLIQTAHYPAYAALDIHRQPQQNNAKSPQIVDPIEMNRQRVYDA